MADVQKILADMGPRESGPVHRVPVHIGQALKAARERHGLSRATVAPLVGKSVAGLAQVEGGYAAPSQEFMTLFAAAIGASTDEWCGWMRARGGVISEAFVAGFDAGRRDLGHLGISAELEAEVLAVSEATRAGRSACDHEWFGDTLVRLIKLGLAAVVADGF